MADGGHLEKKYLAGIIFSLRFVYCGNLSKFESCNGDAFNVIVPKTVTSNFDMFLVSSYDTANRSRIFVQNVYTHR